MISLLKSKKLFKCCFGDSLFDFERKNFLAHSSRVYQSLHVHFWVCLMKKLANQHKEHIRIAIYCSKIKRWSMGGEGRSGFPERAPSLCDNTEQCSQIWRHTTECVWVCSARTRDTMVGGMISAPMGARHGAHWVLSSCHGGNVFLVYIIASTPKKYDLPGWRMRHSTLMNAALRLGSGTPAGAKRL